jgi:DamX protein
LQLVGLRDQVEGSVMTPDSPLRARADNRLTDVDARNMQTGLFDAEQFDAPEKENNSLLNDYRQRYGLSEDPFSDDPGFPLFTGGGRRQVLDQLLHLCQFSNNLLVITGEQGVGKTRIAHAMADSLEEQDQLCFLALSPGQTLEQLLVAIAESFNIEIPSPVTVESLLSELENFIDSNSGDEEAESEGLILIIIDNAEHLDSQSMAVLASLIENRTHPNPAHIVLVGEPRLISKLNGVESESLHVSDFHLPAFNLSETVDYLNFRMEMADYLGPEIFSEAVVDPWWRQARGQLSIVHEFAQDKLLQSVIPPKEPRRSSLPLFHILAIPAVIAVAGVFYLYLDDEQPEKNMTTQIVTSAPASLVQSSTASSPQLSLTSTQTPVQPVLQSLPDSSATDVSSDNSDTSEFTANDRLAVTNDPLVQDTASTGIDIKPIALDQANNSRELPDKSLPNIDVTSSIPEETVKNNPPAASTQNVSRLAEPKPAKSVDPSDEYTQHEQKILAWSPSQFTIQLLGVSSLKSAQEFVSSQANKSELLIFKTKRSGKDWYVVVTGHYPSNAQARAAIGSLPAQQRDAGPWPRQIQVIQKEIRQ